MKKNDFFIIISFFGIIFLFFVGSILKEDVKLSEQENRVLAQKPEMTCETLLSGAFPKNYETYLSEQFLCRNQLITLHSFAELTFQKKEINNIYYGKNGYLFERQEREKEQIKKNTEYVKCFVDKYQKQVEDVSILLIPDKAEVLTEHLPSYYPFVNDEKQIMQIYESCESANTISIFEIMMQNKDEEPLFYKTDHHWTSYGSYLAYEQWKLEKQEEPKRLDTMKKVLLTENFRGTLESKTNLAFAQDTIWCYEAGETETSYTICYDETHEANSYLEPDKLKTKDKYSVFFGGNYGKVEINTSVSNGKRLLVIKDSFANAFVPFLLDEYEEIIMIDLRYYNQSMEKLLDESEFTEVLIIYSMNEFSKTDLYKLVV